MTDLLVELAVSNLLISAAMAAAAYAVHRQGRYPGLAHLLWVLVLLKAITPPLLTLPIIPGIGAGSAVVGEVVAGPSAARLSALESIGAGIAANGVTTMLLVWALGSLLVLAASLLHIYRFDRLLRHTSVKAPVHVQAVASGIARELGLRSAPVIFTSDARLSPMTWWLGRHVRVVIPAALESAIGPGQLHWVLAHELAHIKRRDYLVRWLEWLACVAFWWNPVVWWSRRNLRLDEEISCDALVLDQLGAPPRSYAEALLTVMEFLSRGTDRRPAVATGIDAGGTLERRFTSIISGSRVGKAPRWLAFGLTGTALMVMSVGVTAAVEPARAQGPLLNPERTTSQLGVNSVLTPDLGLRPPDDADLSATLDDRDAAPAESPRDEASAFLSAEIGGPRSRNGLASATTPAKRARRWDNVFVGTADADTLAGSDGRDKIVGRAGPDVLSGGRKRDLI
ncbi:MAG: M56 family metallopeptidase, partial [Chloroflexota bacterium]